MNIFTLLITEPLANGLILFYKLLFNNMGLAIIAFSIFLKVITNPLTKPYMDSMKKIKALTPELEKLKKKYKNDRQALMKAQADFYKEHKINPGAGCLTQILQIVILISLYNIFIQVLNSNGSLSGNFNSLLYSPLKFEENATINTNFLYLNIAKPDVIKIPGLNFPLPGPLIILAALTQFLSAKMASPYLKIEEKLAKKTKEKEDDMQVALQNSMIYTFPLMTILIGVSFPSGVALYWLVFSLTQMWTQYKSGGFGALTPWLKRLGLLKSLN